MTSSFVPELALLWPPLPMLALGLPAIASAILSLSLPETVGRPLPQTLEEALAIGVDKPNVSTTKYIIKLYCGEWRIATIPYMVICHMSHSCILTLVFAWKLYPT